ASLAPRRPGVHTGRAGCSGRHREISEEDTMYRTVTSLAAAAMLFGADLAAIPPAAAQENRPSLYERLGGVYSIATVVDDFIERLLIDATLNANPAISEARARGPKAGLKFPRHAPVCD